MLANQQITRDKEIELAWRQYAVSPRMTRLKRIEMRVQLAEAQNWRCCLCGDRLAGEGDASDAPSLVQLTLRSNRSIDDPRNLVVMCRKCSQRRDTRIWLDRMSKAMEIEDAT